MTQDMKCDTKGVDEVRREIQPELSWKHPDVRGKTKSKSDQESKEQEEARTTRTLCYLQLYLYMLTKTLIQP